jgi:diguanylate cyclase (GGDEF)-like protein
MITGRIKSTQKLILEGMPWVQELHRRAYEDSGTGLWKQAIINDEVINELKDPSALIMLKPDRFKILVDSRGHSAGDEAMIRIAIILKNITRQFGHSWPLRFKSNEVGIIINNCYASLAENIAEDLGKAIAALEPVPAQGDIPPFHFSSTITWAIWPQDEIEWDSLFHDNYAFLLDNWRDGGERIVRYTKGETS